AVVGLSLLAACGWLGFREHPAGDASGDGFDAPGDSGGSAARCGGMTLLADTFAANTPAQQWYTYAHGGITTLQTGGEAVITLPATTLASSNYGGFQSVLRFDLRGQRVAVEVPQTTST